MLKKSLMVIVILILATLITYSKTIENRFEKEDYVDVIISLKDSRSFDKAFSKLDKNEITESFEYKNINAFSARIKKSAYKKLMADVNVENIKESSIKHILLEESVPLINADDIWNLTQDSQYIRGAGQTICVIDTGIKTTHTAFSNRILAQHCFCRIDGGCCPNNQTEDVSAEDDHGHGTHCAGIAAGNHSVEVGVAREAGIAAVKACDASGSCHDSDIIAGIDWCIDNSEQYNITVISISLGDNSSYNSYCNSDPTAEIINVAAANNISVVIASGNEAYTSGISAPACIENATPVGSTNDGYAGSTVDAVSSFTSRGNILELMAPGYAITAPYHTSDITTKAGTSMATPHVAGAIALLKQFLRLQNNTALTPNFAEDILNSTGVPINDTASNKFYSRIDVMAAISVLNNPPHIHFANNSAANNSYSNNSALINITSNEILSWAWLEFNNTNTTMNGTGTNFWITVYGNSTYNYTVYANDTFGKVGSSLTRIINLINIPPQIQNLSIRSTDSLNRTNGSLFISFFSYDEDSEIVFNETRWLNNSAEIISFQNMTSVNSTFVAKNQNWTAVVRTFDGAYYSQWSNTTISIKNSAPLIENLNNISVNESIQVNITLNITDMDQETLEVAINSSFFTLTNYTLTWNTSVNDSGNYSFNITVNDSESSASTVISVSVFDQPDLDDDGIPDFADYDDDNDQINDSVDFILGNSSDINASNLQITLEINGSSNISIPFNSTYMVNISESNNPIVEFNWSFTASNILNLYNVTIKKQRANESRGTLIINGINLINKTKTVFLDRIANLSYVCIKDEKVDSIDSISSGCSQRNEFFVSCDGSSTTYNCTIISNGTKFKIKGLNHSAVSEQCQDSDGDGYGIGCLLGTDCNDLDAGKAADCTVQQTSSGGGGGGGGGTITLKNDENTLSSSFLNMRKITKYMLSGKKETLAVTKAEFYVKEFRLKGTLTINTSKGMPEKTLENTYQFFEVTPGELLKKEDIIDPVIEFRVKKTWIKKNDIEKIFLSRFTDKWNTYTADKIATDDTYEYFESKVPGFSLFAINGIKKEVEILKENKTTIRNNETLKKNSTNVPLTQEIAVEAPSKQESNFMNWIFIAAVLFPILLLTIKKVRKEIWINKLVKETTKKGKRAPKKKKKKTKRKKSKK